jgi:hypothetical protein
MIVSRDVPKFGLPTGAYFDHGSGQAQLTAMGARIVGFMCYLILSYGMVYFLLATKRSLGGWNTKEQLISPAIMAAIICDALMPLSRYTDSLSRSEPHVWP